MAEKEYIERRALIEEIRGLTTETWGKGLKNGWWSHSVQIKDNFLRLIEKSPAADVVEVRRGEWEIKSEIHQMLDDIDEELYVECPFCRRTFYVPYEFEDEKIIEYARRNYPYCHCGAKMDGGKTDV